MCLTDLRVLIRRTQIINKLLELPTENGRRCKQSIKCNFTRVLVLNIKQVDVIVLGAGAAGLFCAAQAGKRGRSVAVLDHAKRIGGKILMSGGGRCNFTNMYASHENFLCDNKHFCKSALSRYTQWDFIDLVERHGIAYHERQHGEFTMRTLSAITEAAPKPDGSAPPRATARKTGAGREPRQPLRANPAQHS